MHDAASYTLANNQLISQRRGTADSFYLHDALGSTRGLADGTGFITDTYAYTAFGEMYSQSGDNTPNSYLFAGQMYDATTELYQMRARYYDPSVGRFTSRDAADYNLQNPIELNRYGYTANTPVNLTDPSGYFSLAQYGGLSGVAVATGAALLPFIPEFIGLISIIGIVMGLLIAPPSTGVDFDEELRKIQEKMTEQQEKWDNILEEIQKGMPDPGGLGFGLLLKVVLALTIVAKTVLDLVQDVIPVLRRKWDDLRGGVKDDKKKKPCKPGDPKCKQYHLTFGLQQDGIDLILNSFTRRLKHSFKRVPNAEVFDFGKWPLKFNCTFSASCFVTATTHPQTVRLYFNLEGIKKGKTSYTDFIYNRSGRQIGGDPLAAESVTAWELYQIQHTGLCSKTMFFENGSTSLVPSPAAKAEICSGY